jgi:hypothetical protein
LINVCGEQLLSKMIASPQQIAPGRKRIDNGLILADGLDLDMIANTVILATTTGYGKTLTRG